MMQNLHLASVDDDLYSGYNEYPSALSTKDLEEDEVFQEALRTSYGRRPIPTAKPPTAMRLGTSSGYREGTGLAFRPVTGSQDTVTRPMTAVRGAGYTSQRPGTMFDPLNQAAKMGTPQLETKKEETPEEKIRKLERRITELIEESCLANSRSEHKTALDKAKEASAKERSLIRMQEQTGLSENHNLDLTFSVLFNLANQYAANEMYTEALNTYQVITKNRMFTNANRLKINMGNIFFKLGQYPKAVKMYRMALDQVPNTHRELRIKIMHNIGILFVKMGQFNDACSSFDYIMQEKPEFSTGLHLILCHFAVGDKERMKRAFQMLLEVPLNIDDEDRYTSVSDDPSANLILEVIKTDSLRKMERQMKHEAEKSILTAAKLISPVIEDTYSAGYDWCVNAIKMSNYALLANDLEINKAVMYLKQKEFSLAIDTLKMFEKKETKVASTAATNLSFIYLLQGDLEQAEKYGEQAREADGYNSAAFVNLGNVSFAKRDLEKAKELYAYALENDASCVEALYNLGLVNKHLGLYDESLECFSKLQAITRHHPQVLYQLAHLYELVSDVDQATYWYHQLISIVPSDPGILRKMGEICENEGDKQQAYHFHYDSYRYFPSNFDVIDWLASYYIEMQVAEKAIVYFQRAALMQPDEIKWQLMVATCLKRSGNLHQAMNTYKKIHERFPENTDCLRFLIQVCTDLGLNEATEYAIELKKAEKAKEVRERISSSSRPGSRRSGSGLSSRGGSAAGGSSPLSDRNSPLPSTLPGTQPNSGKKKQQRSIKMIEHLMESDNEDDDRHFTYGSTMSNDSGISLERPKTSAGQKSADIEFDDDVLGDDLLPE